MPLAAALGVIATAEFVMLVVAEWRDGNIWSLVTRLAGVVLMLGIFAVGWKRWRAFKRAVKEEQAKALQALAPLPEGEAPPLTLADLELPVCAGKLEGCYEVGGFASGICQPCWTRTVDAEFQEMDARLSALECRDNEPQTPATPAPTEGES